MESVVLEHVSKNSFIYFNTPSSQAKEMFSYVDWLGHFYCYDEYHVERQYYNSFLLLYIKTGNGYARFNGKSYHLDPDSIFLINGRLPHAYGAEKLMEMYWLHFDGQGVDKIYQYITQQFGPVITSSLLGKALMPLVELIEDYQNNMQIPEPIASSLIHRLLAEIIVAAQVSGPATITSKRLSQQAIRFIEKNYSGSISILDLAQSVNLSQYHFARIFKEDTGYTPIEFLMSYRVNQAKMLLKTTDLPISVIAAQCGFQSTSYFSTCFRKNTGATPHIFRKSLF